jgi:hypothetical protein
MRRGELLKLSNHVDFGLNVINVKQTKTGKDRSVPMDVSVRETLVGLREGLSDDDFVFMNSRTGVQLTDVKHGFKSACRDAGVLDLNFHDLRHTWDAPSRCRCGHCKDRRIDGPSINPNNTGATHTTDEGKRAAIAQLASYRRENCHNLPQQKCGRPHSEPHLVCCLVKVVSRAGLEPATHWLKPVALPWCKGLIPLSNAFPNPFLYLGLACSPNG